MNDQKPRNLKEYREWLRSEHQVDVRGAVENHYDSVTRKIQDDFETSDFWEVLTNNLSGYDQAYLVNTGYSLLGHLQAPELLIKPFDSFVLKTFRKNVLNNRTWPDEPKGGWILPDNWFSRIGDVVRTFFVVKYLDGVEFFAEQIESLCVGNLTFRKILEAREEGYYAAHLYITQQFEIPTMTFDTELVSCSIELQVSTQVQEVIRKLLHKYYEERRKSGESSKVWQWDYKSEEFAANYLGHILHYLEGMIMEVRARQEGQSGGT